MTRVLCIGCGNTLRGDDGAGVRAVERLRQELPGSRCLAVQQLTVDLAEELSEADIALIIDAAVDVQDVTTRLVQVPEGPGQPRSHFETPESLLLMARELYQRIPLRFYTIRIPAVTFDFSEQLSPVTAAALDRTVDVIKRLVSV